MEVGSSDDPEHLSIPQVTCERGFTSMEESHTTIVAELQRRYQQEVERLLVERDQLLEEESAATATGEEETLCKTDETQQIKRQNAEFILSSVSDRSHQERSEAGAGEGGGEE